MQQQQAPQGGVIDIIGSVGKGCGFVAALLGTPPVFTWSFPAIHAYFAGFFGPGFLTEAVSWLMGAVEAVLIFWGTALVVVFIGSWLMTVLVARGLR